MTGKNIRELPATSFTTIAVSEDHWWSRQIPGVVVWTVQLQAS